MRRILVTGGTGVLGRQVVQRLSQKADVRVLSRAARPDPGVVRGDLETGAGLAAACQGVDVIVHCAGIHDYLRDVRATRRLPATCSLSAGWWCLPAAGWQRSGPCGPRPVEQRHPDPPPNR